MAFHKHNNVHYRLPRKEQGLISQLILVRDKDHVKIHKCPSGAYILTKYPFICNPLLSVIPHTITTILGQIVPKLFPSNQARTIYPPSPHIVQNSRELSVKGASAPPLIGGLPSTGGPGCAISRRRGYILQSRTLSHDWERAGNWVEHERRFTYELYQQSL